MMRMIRAGRAVPGEDGHGEHAGGVSAGAGREQDRGMAPGPARRRLRAPVHDGAGHRARRVDAAAVRAVRPRRRSRLGAVPGPGDRRGPGPFGVRCRGPARVPAAGVGGRPRPRRHRAGDRDVQAGPVRAGVAPAAGAVRAVGDAAGRHGGGLRPEHAQRPAAARAQGDYQRGRAPPDPAADGGRPHRQGPPRGARGPAAVRHGPAGGDAGTQVQGDQRFAPAWVAVEHGQLAEGEAFGPEPCQLSTPQKSSI